MDKLSEQYTITTESGEPITVRRFESGLRKYSTDEHGFIFSTDKISLDELCAIILDNQQIMERVRKLVVQNSVVMFSDKDFDENEVVKFGPYRANKYTATLHGRSYTVFGKDLETLEYDLGPTDWKNLYLTQIIGYDVIASCFVQTSIKSYNDTTIKRI